VGFGREGLEARKCKSESERIKSGSNEMTAEVDHPLVANLGRILTCTFPRICQAEELCIGYLELPYAIKVVLLHGLLL
jgi:hypothetical protein